ncbi:MAG: DUF2142 domain-containing protein [Anaerolineae bacterium]
MSTKLTILLLFTLINGLAWVAVIPFAGFPDGAPDEIHHFEVTRFIGATGRVPIFGPDADLYIRVRPGAEDTINNRIYGWHALFPLGAYILPGLFIHVLPELSLAHQVLAARLFSVLSLLCLVYFAYRIAVLLFDDGFLHLGIPLFVSLVPQITFIGAYHNPDASTIAATTAAMYFALKMFIDDSFILKDALGLGLALSFVAMMKQHGWLTSALFVGMSALWTLFRRPKVLWQWMLVAAPLPLLVFGSWFLMQWLRYGDIFGQEVFLQAWMSDRPFLVSLAEQGFTLVDFFLHTNWLVMTFKSFWGMFGYMSVEFSPAIYWGLALLCIGGFVGLLLGIIRRWNRHAFDDKQLTFQALIIFAVTIGILFAAAVYTSYYQDYQPQGRYLLPVIVPVVTFILLGWRELLRPVNLWSVGIRLLGTGLILLNFVSLVFYVIPGMWWSVDEQWFF